MTLQTIAQLIMLATLILMITGRTPIYMTAITGAAISAIVAGFPLAGGQGMTVTKMIVSGLNPVIADMTGILLFIGIMQATGFLDVIIRDIVRVGRECQDFCVWGGYSRGSPTRLPFVFEMQYARPDAIAGAKVEGPARSAGGSSLAPAIARREAAGALAREV